MIGQEKLIKQLETLIKRGNFPRFSILVGVKGSGRKLLAHQLASKLNCLFVSTETSVSDVRHIIENSYKVTAPTLYLIPDADNMSVAARNALLKITEEPPNKCYFIMTLEDINNTLPTIKSRATVFNMDIYRIAEIKEYVGIKYQDNTETYEKVCETPGEVDILYSMNTEEFYNYVEKVVDNIENTYLGNAFKIGGKICLKEGTEGYDLKMFWKAFCQACFERYENTQSKAYLRGIVITSEKLKLLRNKSINRQMLFDLWIQDIREEWI